MSTTAWLLLVVFLAALAFAGIVWGGHRRDRRRDRRDNPK
jgi:hypothetical protein